MNDYLLVARHSEPCNVIKREVSVMDEEIKDLNGEEPVTESANSTANKDVTAKKERWGLRWLAVIVSGLVIGAVIAVVFIAITTGK